MKWLRERLIRWLFPEFVRWREGVDQDLARIKNNQSKLFAWRRKNR